MAQYRLVITKISDNLTCKRDVPQFKKAICSLHDPVFQKNKNDHSETSYLGTYILDLGAERQRTNIPEQGFELNLINPDVLRETFQL